MPILSDTMNALRGAEKWKMACTAVLLGGVISAISVVDSYKVVVRTDLPVAAKFPHHDVLVVKR